MDNPLLRLLSPQPMQYQQGSGAMPVMQQPQMQPQQMAPNKGMNFMRDLVAGALLSYGGAGVAPVLAGQQNRRKREEEMFAQQQEMATKNKTVEYFKKLDPELAVAIENGVIDGGTAYKIWTDKQRGAEAPTPYTDIAKAKRDLDSGYLTPEQFQQITSGQGGMDPQEAFKRESDLRKEYSGSDVVKNYGTVRDYYERIRSGVTAGTGAGDIAAVFSYMKMLDPASTVREGEYATAQNAAGAPEGMRGLYNQLIGGGSLSGKARKQLYDQAQKTYIDVEKNLRDQNSRYGQIAGQWQVSPDNVLVQPEQYDPLSLPPTTGNVGDPVPVQAPQAGQIVDGYRFKGGDPANPNSWEQVM
jgi:hypothetical protein